MNPHLPHITATVPVFNDAERVVRAVRSLLDQDYPSLDVVVIDDASTDHSADALDAIGDPRVRVVRLTENLGSAGALNVGLNEAVGPLIARLDADDIALPGRLRAQADLLQARPEIDLVCSWTTEIDDHDNVTGGFTTDPDEHVIRWDLLRRNPIFHSTVLVRRDTMDRLGGYDERFRLAQDHELFTRLVRAGGRIAMIAEPLVLYRRGASHVTSRQGEAQRDAGRIVRQRHLAWLLDQPELSPELADAYADLLTPLAGVSFPSLDLLEDAIAAVRAARDRILDDGANHHAARSINHEIRRCFLDRSAQLQHEGRHAPARRLARACIDATGPAALLDQRLHRRFAKLTLNRWFPHAAPAAPTPTTDRPADRPTDPEPPPAPAASTTNADHTAT